MKIKMPTGRSSGVSVGILIGVLVCVGVTLIATVILAWLITAEKMGESAVGYGAMVALLLSAILGSWTASAKIGRLRTQVCLITGGIYYLVLLSITALFFGGQYQGMGVAAILVIAGSGVTALLGIREKKSRKNKIKKRAFC
ncbi:MAG: TIGR04086 family membrane protein [Oscillospiraceae bacterium]|nr:TIGR04086 family membrane protein [Oscillospiraceae bacterium]